MMSIDKIQAEIVREIPKEMDWADKYGRLIKLGRALPDMEPEHKTADNLVRGCQVKAWLRAEFRDGQMFYSIDSDSLVVRGVISLLVRVCSGQRPADIVSADLNFIDQIGLSDKFMPTDPSNLEKIFSRIKEAAASHVSID